MMSTAATFESLSTSLQNKMKTTNISDETDHGDIRGQQVLTREQNLGLLLEVLENDELVEALVNEGVLDQDDMRQHLDNPSRMLSCIMTSSRHLHALCRMLRDRGHTRLATLLLTEGTSATRDRSNTSFLHAKTNSVGHQLAPDHHSPAHPQRSTEEPELWQERVGELEATQELMAEWLQAAVTSEDRVTLELSALREKEALLESRLLERTTGLKLWQQQEKKHADELEAVAKRTEELCRVLRSRDAEIERLKYQQGEYLHQIEQLKVKASKKGRGLLQLPDRKLELPEKEDVQVNLRLPTLVNPVTRSMGDGSTGKESLIGSRNSVDRLPTVEAYNAEPRRKRSKQMAESLRSSADWSNNLKKCTVLEQWIPPSGKKLELPNISVTWPYGAMDTALCVTVTEYPTETYIKNRLKSTGFYRYLEPCIYFGIQPYGNPISKSISVEIKNARISGQGRILIYQKVMNIHHRTQWRDCTEYCSPKVKQDHVTLHMDSLCTVSAMRIVLPVNDMSPGIVYGKGMGIRKHLAQTDIKIQALAIMNDRCRSCTFHLYVKRDMKSLMLVCSAKQPYSPRQEHQGDAEEIFYIGSEDAAFDLCDGEIVYPYLNEDPLWGEEYAVDLRHVDMEGKGQTLGINLEHATKKHKRRLYYHLSLKRKVANTDVITLCTFTIPCHLGKLQQMQASDKEIVTQVLDHFRDKIERTVDVRYLLEPLQRHGVFTNEEVFQISHERNHTVRARMCLDLLTEKGEEAIFVFHGVMSTEYGDLAEEMGAMFSKSLD